MARNPCGKHAVEHVHPPLDAFKQIIWRAHSHQISGLMAGKIFYAVIQHLQHELFRLSYRQSSYGIARKIKIYYLFCALAAKIFVHAALHYAKQRLSLPVFVKVSATAQPSGSPLQRILDVTSVRRIRRTLVKSHHYIRAEGILYLYGFLRSDKMSRTVYMRSESDAFFGDFSEGSQRKYLKTSAVCQNSPVPIHKFVKASRLFHQFMTGTEI